MGVGVRAEKVGGDGVLEERVAQHLQALQIEAIAGVGQGERLQDQPGVGPQALGGVRGPGTHFHVD